MLRNYEFFSWTIIVKVNVLYILFPPPAHTRMNNLGRKLCVEYVNIVEKLTNSYINLIGKSEVTKRLGRPRHRTNHDIKKDLKEMGQKVKSGF
jgi:hypothetical protein